MKSKILPKFTILFAVLFQTIQLYNCQTICTCDTSNTDDLSQLKNAKLIKLQLLDIFKNAEKCIISLDEWAIEKTVNITQTDQISREYIEQVEVDIIKLQSKVNEFQNKSRGFTGDIDEIFNEKNTIERELKLLNEKFERFFGKNLEILGTFYDNHYSEIIDKKNLLNSDVMRLTADIGQMKHKEIDKLLDDCEDAIKLNDNNDVVIKLKLLNNYENDLNIIIKLLYRRINGLEFTKNIDLRNFSNSVYQQIMGNIHKFSDQEKIKVLQAEQRFVNSFGRADNISDVLIEPWKDLIKMYLKMSEARTLDDHMEVIREIIQLDEKLLPKAMEEVFEDMINSDGQLAATEEDFSRISSAYFDALKRIVRYLQEKQSDNNFIVYLGNKIKNQLAVLKKIPAFNNFSNGAELINEFPSSLRSLIFSDYVCIKNRDGQYLITSDAVIDRFKNLTKLSKHKSTAWKIKQHDLSRYEIISEQGTLLLLYDETFNFGYFAYTNKNIIQTESDAKFWSFDYEQDGIIIRKSYLGYLGRRDNSDIVVLRKYPRYEWYIEDCKSDNLSP